MSGSKVVDFCPGLYRDFFNYVTLILEEELRYQRMVEYIDWCRDQEIESQPAPSSSPSVDDNRGLFHVYDLNASTPPPWVPVFPSSLVQSSGVSLASLDEDLNDYDDDCPPTVPVSPERDDDLVPSISPVLSPQVNGDPDMLQLRTAWDAVRAVRPDTPPSPTVFHLDLDCFLSDYEFSDDEDDDLIVEDRNKIKFI